MAACINGNKSVPRVWTAYNSQLLGRIDEEVVRPKRTCDWLSDARRPDVIVSQSTTPLQTAAATSQSQRLLQAATVGRRG